MNKLIQFQQEEIDATDERISNLSDVLEIVSERRRKDLQEEVLEVLKGKTK